MSYAVPNWNKCNLCKPISFFKDTWHGTKYARYCKQRFSSHPAPTFWAGRAHIYGDCQNLNMLSLESLCQWVLLCCVVGNIQLRAWTRKKRSLLFCNCNCKELGAPIKGDGLGVIVASLWRTMLSYQGKLTPKTRYPKLVIVYAI